MRLVAPGAQEPGGLPIMEDGATYTMAQEAIWLDGQHFAVGRWDGTLSIFSFQDSATQGPIVTTAASDRASEGVQMLCAIASLAFVSSSGDGAMTAWAAPSGDWSSIVSTECPFDESLGAANSAAQLSVDGTSILAVGHANGYLSVWEVDGTTIDAGPVVNLRNPNPVNPWDLHNIRGVRRYADDMVVTGSEDGFLSVVQVPNGSVISQTIYNPAAQRGINSIAVDGDDLLVANCSVGASDSNLWYFKLNPSSGAPTLVDRANLKVNPQAPQVFNFCTIWAAYDNGRCFFSSTEEGALWMGTIDEREGGLSLLGYDRVTTPLGSALTYRPNGWMVLAGHDLYEYKTIVPDSRRTRRQRRS